MFISQTYQQFTFFLQLFFNGIAELKKEFKNNKKAEEKLMDLMLILELLSLSNLKTSNS